MGCSEDYNPGSSRCKHFVKHLTCKKQYPLPLAPTPTLLKDFLFHDSISCSSSGFKSLPRKQPPSDEPEKPTKSKSNVSALGAMINALKSIRFMKNSSLSRSLSRRGCKNQDSFEKKIAVRVKDIIRWKSFRDDVQEEEEELAPPSQSQCSTASSSPSSGSKGSSWCESDFSSEWWWQGQGEVSGDLSNSGKRLGVGGGRKAEESANCAEAVGHTEDDKEEGKEQTSSPLSITDEFLGSNNGGEEEEEEEGAFEKAWQLLDRAKCWRSILEAHEEQLLLDFFTEELMSISSSSSRDSNSWKQLLNRNHHHVVIYNGNDEEEEEIMVSKARAWIGREREVIRTLEVEAGSKRDACIKAMDKEVNWSKFGGGGEEEGEEVALGIEAELFDDLINGVLADILLL